MKDKLFIRLIVSGIDMGEIEVSPGEKIELQPVDCFLSFHITDTFSEGLSTDGIQIKAHKDLDDVLESGGITFEPKLHYREQKIENSNVNSGSPHYYLGKVENSNGMEVGEIAKESSITVCEKPEIVMENDKFKEKEVFPPHPPFKKKKSTRIKNINKRELKACKDSIVSTRENSGDARALSSLALPEPCLPGKEVRVGVRAGTPKKGKPIPANYLEFADGSGGPPEGVVEYAQKILGESLTTNIVRIIFENFVDHHLKTGKEWVDWSRAWHTWVRNEGKFNSSQEKSGTHTPAGKMFDPRETLKNE